MNLKYGLNELERFVENLNRYLDHNLTDIKKAETQVN